MCYDSIIIIDFRLISKKMFILKKYSVVSMVFKKAIFSILEKNKNSDWSSY